MVTSWPHSPKTSTVWLQASGKQGEQEWLGWLVQARDKAIPTHVAAEKMGITERWVRALLAASTDLQ